MTCLHDNCLIDVTQVSNLLYRRFPIGRSHDFPARGTVFNGSQAGSLRYSRLETCVTLSGAIM